MTTTSDPRQGDQLGVSTTGATAVVPHGSRGHPISKSRRTRLTVSRIDPWSVLRLSFMLSMAVAIVTIVAILLLWMMLSAGGVFDSVDTTMQDILGDGALTVTQYFGFGRVFAFALLIGAIDVVLLTALATIGAFLFNVVASLAGGLEVSVSEDL